MRYLAIDFETNGLPHDRVRPFAPFPTQVSVDSFDTDTREVVHLYDSFIRGAQSLSPWVLEHTPVTLERLQDAPRPSEVSDALEGLCLEGDVLVAHNARFDRGKVLPRFAAKDHALMRAPVVDTMRDPWVRATLGTPRLEKLCSHLGVPYVKEEAHDARYDSHVLAHCLQKAHEKGHSWTPCGAFEATHRIP